MPDENRRKKLTIQEQINYMRDEKGILFTITTEEEAKKFLTESNYYFKLKAFEKNYSKYNSGENAGKYCDIEFAYLQELSILDVALREMVLSLSLDIEHYLKVILMTDLSEDENEDGYQIVDTFLQHHPDVRDKIEGKAANSYCEKLIRKYSENYPVWIFVEVLSMGDLITFCEEYYYNKKGRIDRGMIGSLRIVKFLRNAAAHNNLLINNLADNAGTDFKQNREVNSFINTIQGISSRTRNKKMGNRTMHDLCVLLLTFDRLASESSKHKQYTKLRHLLDVRMVRHKEYFEKNMLLTSNYEFLKKVVDRLTEASI